ncbi:MAG: symmetrical bis(5'-nucleosyl)-tetraphosphatase, partial [Acidobacteriota bacterium]|nr:symmetrical bis(5'-nucleosyl)-tetraphosphatase [Acidobacteriota bacterium]
MATYAIGDVHGCWRTLRELLRGIGFRESSDRLWFTGDLVNRGPSSLDVLRFVMDLGDAAVTVLGNHDLHLLARAAGLSSARPKDTLVEILEAPDREKLLAWLRGRPLLHQEDGFVLVHAGLLPEWSVADAADAAALVERELRGAGWTSLVQRGVRRSVGPWSSDFSEQEKRETALNAMTRMRAVAGNGAIDVRYTGSPSTMPDDLVAWFDAPGRRSRGVPVVFGHWAALGLLVREDAVGLDSGCVWGGALSCLRL